MSNPSDNKIDVPSFPDKFDIKPIVKPASFILPQDGKFSVLSSCSGYASRYPVHGQEAVLNIGEGYMIATSPYTDSILTPIVGIVDAIDRNNSHYGIRQLDTNIRVEVYIGAQEIPLIEKTHPIQPMVKVGDTIDLNVPLCKIDYEGLKKLTDPATLILVQSEWYPHIQITFEVEGPQQVTDRTPLMTVVYKKESW